MVLVLISTEWVTVQFMDSSKSSEIHVKTISDAVGLVTSRITKNEQVVNNFTYKMVSFAEMEGQKISAKSGMNLLKKTFGLLQDRLMRSYIQNRSRGVKKRHRTMVSYTEQRRQKWPYEFSI